jgi:NAD+ synthase (glutamine-hydrolysing)
MARASGAQVLLALNASPFHLEKQQERIDISRRNISRLGMPFIFCNLVGGQDELVFDGGSFVLDGEGALVAQAKMFQEDLLMVAVDDRLASGRLAPSLSYEEQAYQALVLGTRDYVQKNGFSGAVLGLSGGVDSALVLAIAVDALGPDKVRAVMMPSPYTLAISIEDAAACAKALGVQLSSLPIEPLMSGFAATLSPALGGLPQGLTEENLQARIRGNLLMAISNQTGALLLATGNKSEIAVGYCTLYGDMSGGFALIKDLVKGMVYRLCRLRNQQSQVIPDRILSRAPSAELKHDQTDQDSLPPYDALDDMLVRFVEQGQSRRDLVAAGHAEADVDRVLRMIRLSEYKRRQAAPGVRISPRAFGRDWRYPLTNRFVEQSYNLEEGGKT